MAEDQATVGHEALGSANQERAQQVLLHIGSEDLFDLVAEDVVVEFPYGPSVGMPERFVNKSAFRAYCHELFRALPGVTTRDMTSYSVDGDPNTVFVEYEVDLSAPVGEAYVQPHVVKMEFRDGLLVHMKEFWDPERMLGARSGAFGLDPPRGTTPMADVVVSDLEKLRGATGSATRRAEGA